MIYQPINAWPTTKAIDVSRDNTFSVEINTSGSVIAYQLTILDWENSVVYSGSVVTLEEPLYNGDMLYFNPSLNGVLVNGNDYKWRLRLFQDNVSIPITSGYITSKSGTRVVLPINNSIKVGMHIKIGSDNRLISNIDASAKTVTSGTITSIEGKNIVVPLNTSIKSGMYFNIGSEKRQIYTVYNSDTTLVTLSSAFDDSVTGGNYTVTSENTETITVNMPFSPNNNEDMYTVVSNFLDTAPDFVLYARTTPVVRITNFSDVISDRHYVFTGSYTQAEYVPMTYYQIKLSIVQNNVSREIYDTGKVYRADIKLDYDGFLTGNQYQLELTVANESNVVTTTGIKNFKVQYDTVEFLTEPQLYLDCNKHAIRINWTTPISIDPTVYNVAGSLTGTIRTWSGNTIEIDKGLEIHSGAIVIFDSKFENEVSVYNPETGLLAFKYALEDDIQEGSTYVILNTITNVGNMELLKDTPYRMTNSVNTLENALTFQNKDVGYIGKTPENDNITFQFNLPEAFWDGVLTRNMRLLPMLRLHTDNNDIRGFEVFLNLNKLVFIKPAIDGTSIYKTQIQSIVSDTSFVLTEPIDFNTQKYMRFDGYDDIIEVLSYDATTQTVILVEKPHFMVNVGDGIAIYDTLSYEFYNLLPYFPLQEQGTWNSTYDYIWDDTKSWDDTLYWFEGGGAKQRVSNTWFKARINGSEMDVRAGGV